MATFPGATASPNHFPPSLTGFSWRSSATPESIADVVSPSGCLIPPAEKNSAARREQVLLAHLPLVRYVARRVHERLPQHIDIEDLISAGIVGLVDAYEKFDAARKIQFRSYAQFRIRGAILDSLRSLDWGSREMRRKAREIESAVQQLTQRMGEKPQENQIAEELGISLREYQRLIGELRNLEISSLHQLHAEGSLEEELAFVPVAPEEDPFFRCMQRERAERLAGAIRDLPKRDAQVLSLYYVEGMTLREIGAAIGLAESRVSQIKTAAIQQLRTRLTRSSIMPRLRSTQTPASVLRRQSNAGLPLSATGACCN